MIDLVLRSLEAKAALLKTLSIRRTAPVREWIVDGHRIELPYSFNDDEAGAEVRLEAVVDTSVCGELEPYLEVDAGFDALVYLDDEEYYGVDIGHRRIPLPRGRHRVVLETTLRHTLGEIDSPPVFRSATLLCIDPLVEEFADHARWLIELIRETGDEELRTALLDVLRGAMRLIHSTSIPPGLLEYAAREGYLSKWRVLFDEVLRLARRSPELMARAGFREPDYDRLRREVADAHRVLMEGIRGLRERYGKRGLLYAVAYAHIDTAWLWPYSETIRKVARTFASTLKVLERHPEPVFVESSAQFYAWVKEHYPGLYRRVLEKIREGRWVPVGGMWVEPDTVLVSLEGLVRQLLYGQRFFARELGSPAKWAWLPDSFGYQPALPQLLRDAGITVFYIHKLLWNKYNRFPYHTFLWRGLDGTLIPCVTMVKGYNLSCSARSIIRSWSDYNEKHLVPATVYVYGYGDGGGGPNEEMVRRLRFYAETPGTPRIIHGGLDELEKLVMEAWDKLPVWSGELYLELHRGTYTTNATVKQLVRRAEYLLQVAEHLSVLRLLDGARYPGGELGELWRILLRNMFHDVLPGTSVHEAYVETMKELRAVAGRAEEIIADALSDMVCGEPPLLAMYNPLGWRRRDYVEVELPRGLVPRGVEAYQVVSMSGDRWRIVFPVEIDATRLAVLPLTRARDTGPGGGGIVVVENGDRITVDNGAIRVTVARDGRILSIVDAVDGYEYLAKASNVVTVHEDIPYEWDAWDIDEETLSNYTVLPAEEVYVAEKGPLRARIVARYRGPGGSWMEMNMIMYRGVPRIDFRVRIDWRQRRRLIKTWFHVNANTDKAVYGVAGGFIERPSHRNTSWDRARFEVYMNNWVDVGDGSHGVALASYERYGVSVYFASIGLSLAKYPVYPDPLSDAGEITVTYTLIPHRGTWMEAGVHREAEKLLKPIYTALIEKPRCTTRAPSQILRSLPDNIVLDAIKKAEDTDEIIIRIHETLNKYTVLDASDILGIKHAGITETNILEEKRVETNTVTLTGFRIKTIAVKTPRQ